MRTRLLLVAAVVVVAVAALLATSGDGPAERAPRGAYVGSVPGRAAVVWAVGDTDGTAGGRAVAARIGAEPFDRLLYLGDVYERGTAAEFQRNYATTLGRFAARTAPTPGNHEWDRRASGYEPYWKREHGTAPPAYYAFSVAGWRVLALNSEAEHGSRSAQVRWLRRQVRGGGTCRIAFWHHPRFSTGEHGDQRHTAALWSAVRGRARLVLGGHDHDMQRLRPVDGLTQIVSGAGGRELRRVDGRGARAVFAEDRVHGAVRLRLRPRRAVIDFVAADGRVLDRSSVSCRR
jgi:hypothetical protein